MARQPGQIFMFSDAEFELAKGAFGDSDGLLYLIRKVLLQFPMSKAERDQLKSGLTMPLYDLVRKRVFPELDPESPINQIGDIYQTLNGDLQTRSVDDMYPIFESRELVKEYLEQQFEVLKDVTAGTKETIILDDLKTLRGKTPHDMYVHTKARNFILSHVDPMLGHLKTMGGMKNETVEQTKERLKRDSSK